METAKFQTTVLTASEGMYITQAKDVEVMERLVVKTVALGKNGSLDDYKEISEKEGKAILEEQDAIRQEKMKKFEEEEK